VKLSQAAPAAGVEAAPVKVAPLKKKTITCLKGKTVKKVTAMKPACPAGFKKR
jgi:hypothetical protein